jgi:AraC-like DNA-binding protein
MRKKHGPVLFRWFMSYLAILVIPLVFSGAVYFYSFRIINDSSEEIYRAALEQIRTEVDNYFNGVFQTLQQLTLNDNIQALFLVKEKLTPRDQWSMVESIRELKKVQVISPLIDDIFVVLNPLDSVITTSAYMPQDLFYELYYENDAISREEFKTLMKEPKRNEIRLVKDNLLILLSGTEGFPGDKSATLAIACGRQKFDSRYLMAHESNGGRIFIADREDRIVYSSGRGAEISLQGSAGRIGGIPYRVLSRDSRTMNWKYLYFIPKNLAESRARRIQLFTFAGLFICSAFCLFLSYRMTRRNYIPVKKLMDVFSRPERMDRGENEFDWMEKKARDIQRSLGNSLQIAKKYYINALLEKPFDPLTGPAEMERCGIRLEGEWNVVALFVLPEFPSKGRALSENDIDIINTLHLQYVIIHIFTGAAGDRFNVEMTDAGEYAAAIVNWSGDRDAFIPRLEEVIEYTQQEAGEFLHVPVFTALGEPRRGIEGVYYSNLEARETLRYLDLKAGQSILHYRDIRYPGGKYQYTQETEQKLINLVRAGDVEAARGLLRQVWAENTSSGLPPGKMIRLLAYNLLGSLIKGMEQGSLEEDDAGKPGLNDLNFESIPTGELIDTLEKASADVCRRNSLARQNRREAHLSGKVKQYIDGNFRNPDINISITSLQFGMNPAYLSAVFKEETGLSLLEYINTLRIEEGKRLLASGREVTEAAGQCGFRSSGSFIRVFKKLAGVTPGQYREMNRR